MGHANTDFRIGDDVFDGHDGIGAVAGIRERSGCRISTRVLRRPTPSCRRSSLRISFLDRTRSFLTRRMPMNWRRRFPRCSTSSRVIATATGAWGTPACTVASLARTGRSAVPASKSSITLTACISSTRRRAKFALELSRVTGRQSI